MRRPASAELPWTPLEATTNAALVDRVAAEVVSGLRDAGIEPVLLKGASIDRWLYTREAPRLYTDVDLLVRTEDRERTTAVLAELGFHPYARMPTHTDHAEAWLRDDGGVVDLHVRLVGTPGSADVWPVLSTGTERLRVEGTDVQVLGIPARALLLALHAAEHGVKADKTRIDLERGLEQVPPETWDAAAAVAEALDATEPFAVGLRMVPEGRAVADRLGLPTTHSVETAMHAASVPYSSWFVNRLATASGPRAKLRMVTGKLFPGWDFMRLHYPVARRGRIGMALACLYRPLWLVAHTPPAIVTWWRARRTAARAG